MTEKPSPNIKKRVLGRCSRRNFFPISLVSTWNYSYLMQNA